MIRKSQISGMAAVALCYLVAGCGDLGDPVLMQVDVLLNDKAVQSLEISHSGSNFFKEDVEAGSYFRLVYDEPLLLNSAKDHIYLKDASDTRVETSLAQKLADLMLMPTNLMTGGQNHTIVVEAGIDDSSDNTTSSAYNIVFYVK